MNKVAYKEQISIITPVFNRLKELTRLYKSLRTQNNNNFIWIIVDDGSEKTINEIVDIWKKESKFKILITNKEDKTILSQEMNIDLNDKNYKVYVEKNKENELVFYIEEI